MQIKAFIILLIVVCLTFGETALAKKHHRGKRAFRKSVDAAAINAENCCKNSCSSLESAVTPGMASGCARGCAAGASYVDPTETVKANKVGL